MTKISAYDDDETLSDNDRLIGSDNPSGRTKEFPLSALTAYLSTKGIGGASAYDVAVLNGFVGTEEEWLESLVGEQGEQGPAGTVDESDLVHKSGEEEITGKKIFAIPAGPTATAWSITKDGVEKVTASDEAYVISDGSNFCYVSPLEVRVGDAARYIYTNAVQTVWANIGATKSNKLSYEKTSTGICEFNFPDKATGTYTLATTNDIALASLSSGTWTPTSVANIAYNRSYWIKAGEIVTVTVSGTLISSAGTTETMTLPNSFGISATSTGRLLGTGLSSKSTAYAGTSGEAVVRETSTSTEVSVIINNPAIDTYIFSVTFSFIAV